MSQRGIAVTNDVWLGSGSGQSQHLDMVALRAVENRTWVVRSTTTGISAFIDPWGRVHAASPLFEETILHQQITPQHVATPYQSWGDVFAYACVLISTAMALVARRPRHSPVR